MVNVESPRLYRRGVSQVYFRAHVAVASPPYLEKDAEQGAEINRAICAKNDKLDVANFGVSGFPELIAGPLRSRLGVFLVITM